MENQTTERDTKVTSPWAWLNTNRFIIVLVWAVSTVTLSGLPLLARPLAAIAALVVSIMAADRLLAVFFGVLAAGIVLATVLTTPV